MSPAPKFAVRCDDYVREFSTENAARNALEAITELGECQNAHEVVKLDQIGWWNGDANRLYPLYAYSPDVEGDQEPAYRIVR